MKVLLKNRPMIQRRGKNTSTKDDNDSDSHENHSGAVADSYNIGSGMVAMSENKTNSRESDDKTCTLEGKAVFCLHDIDCEWFQGHFIPSGNTGWKGQEALHIPASLGILCIQKRMDECMVCADGGYRELDMKVIRFRKAKNFSIPCISTGGDMLRIRSDNMSEDKGNRRSITSRSVAFDTKRVLTGYEAIPFLRRFFKKIIRQILSDNIEYVSDNDLLELLPDIAIVVGEMAISAEKSFMLPTSSNPTSDEENL